MKPSTEAGAGPVGESTASPEHQSPQQQPAARRREKYLAEREQRRREDQAAEHLKDWPQRHDGRIDRQHEAGERLAEELAAIVQERVRAQPGDEIRHDVARRDAQGKLAEGGGVGHSRSIASAACRTADCRWHESPPRSAAGRARIGAEFLPNVTPSVDPDARLRPGRQQRSRRIRAIRRGRAAAARHGQLFASHTHHESRGAAVFRPGPRAALQLQPRRGGALVPEGGGPRSRCADALVGRGHCARPQLQPRRREARGRSPEARVRRRPQGRRSQSRRVARRGRARRCAHDALLDGSRRPIRMRSTSVTARRWPTSTVDSRTTPRSRRCTRTR